ncbi:MAG: hypothetical protein AAGI17_02950 [Planctomycetota bacterium]
MPRMLTAAWLMALATAASLAQPAAVSRVTPSGFLLSSTGLTEQELIDALVPSVRFGNTSIYFGFLQVSAANQDPVIAAFRDGVRLWERADYETTGDDGRAVGILWDGRDRLYAAFTATGTQAGPDYRRFTTTGWLTSYGSGGGARAAIVLRLDPETGIPFEEGSFFRAQLSTGRTNTVVVESLAFCDNTDVLVELGSFFFPLRTDTSPMTFDGVAPSPFPYRLRMTADMSAALQAEAIGFDGTTSFSPALTECVPPPATFDCGDADLNGDGFADGNDISLHLDRSAAQSQAADVTADGRIDVFDLLEVIGRIEQGCDPA